jgi:hypothetical protein
MLGIHKRGRVMNDELADTDISGLIIRDKYELEIWRVYFQGRLTAHRFASRAAARKYLSSLRAGNSKAEFARAHNGKEIR